jgi:hypothetical protein
MSDSDTEGGVPLIEAQFDLGASAKKRKREAEPDASKDSKKAAKKAKRKGNKKQKAKDIDEDDLDTELGVNHAFERLDGQLIADHVNARTRLYGKELSSVELEDKWISGECRTAVDMCWSADDKQGGRCEIVAAGRSHGLQTSCQPFSRSSRMGWRRRQASGPELPTRSS